MNLSGGPVAGLARYYRIPAGRLVVIHDELDIPFGTIRLKQGGGDNGHNGLRAVTASLGTREYYRVRFGIGRPPGRMDPAVFVLRDFSAAERKELPFLLDRAADAAEALLGEGSRPPRTPSTAPLPARTAAPAGRVAALPDPGRPSTCYDAVRCERSARAPSERQPRQGRPVSKLSLRTDRGD